MLDILSQLQALLAEAKRHRDDFEVRISSLEKLINPMKLDLVNNANNADGIDFGLVNFADQLAISQYGFEKNGNTYLVRQPLKELDIIISKIKSMS